MRVTGFVGPLSKEHTWESHGRILRKKYQSLCTVSGVKAGQLGFRVK